LIQPVEFVPLLSLFLLLRIELGKRWREKIIIYVHLNLVKYRTESGMVSMKLYQFTHVKGEHE
jgi:hypothetical protein